MAIFTPTVSIGEPVTTLGGNGAPPPVRDGGDDGRSNYGSHSFDIRLRRARLGMGVALSGIAMIFVSFTSAYVVRQGLPTLDPRTGALVHDWIPVQLPRLLLVNTLVLLFSGVTMELARRQAAREAAMARAAGASTAPASASNQISWLALTVVLGLAFLTGQWMAWRELAATGFYMATSPSSSFVYLLTGMHGLHLLGGVFALLFAGPASVLRRPIASQVILLDVTGWCWHFMALLWIYIFCLMEFAG
jgi:cytochrome c oxidase subunit III